MLHVSHQNRGIERWVFLLLRLSSFSHIYFRGLFSPLFSLSLILSSLFGFRRATRFTEILFTYAYIRLCDSHDFRIQPPS